MGREGAAAGKPVRGHTATRSAPLRSRAQDADEWRKLSGGSVGKISYNEEDSRCLLFSLSASAGSL